MASITLATSEKICERALEVGRKAGLNPLTVVVLSPGGRLVLYKSQARVLTHGKPPLRSILEAQVLRCMLGCGMT